MKTTVSLLVLSLVAVAVKSATVDKPYTVGSKQLGWISAWMECKKQNKVFATIKSQDDQTKLENLLKPKSGTKKQPEEKQFWVGARFLSTEKKFVWTGKEFNNTTPVSFTNWAPTIPKDQVKTGRCIFLDNRGVWNTEFCHERKYFVCE